MVQDIPLIGQGAPAFTSSSASVEGCVNARPFGSTPPAMRRPLISGGGNVSGTFTIRICRPAAERSGRNVRSLMDL